MQKLSMVEVELVSGADAAATRPKGTNSWGETREGEAYNNSSSLRRSFDDWLNIAIRVR
jgi:hypothetical protein